MDHRRRQMAASALLGIASGGNSGPVYAGRAAEGSLAPYIGTGTPTVARAGTDAMILNSSYLLAAVAANTARFDYFRCITPDVSGKKRHAFSAGAGVPPLVVGGALPGLQFDGLDGNESSMGLNCGVSGFGVATSHGSMKIKATIRRSRTGVVEVIAGKTGDSNPTTNWLLWIDGNNRLTFSVMDSTPAYSSAIGTTSLAAATNYEVEGEWTGTALNVKVNGVQEGTTPATTVLQAPDTITPMGIGREFPANAAFNAGNPFPFAGVIANVQFYRAGILEGHWPMLSVTPTLLIESSATNRVLHNCDMTNAAWTKGATMTTAKNVTGPDGVANSASRLTGGAVLATNTCLQTFVLASSVRRQSAWVQRISGTGTIEMTTDGGVSWVNITGRITSAWNRIRIPAQTVTNPSVGFRITTNGDVIGVYGVQNENDIVTSTIITGAAAVTRPYDNITASTANIAGYRNRPAAMAVQAISFDDLPPASHNPTCIGLGNGVAGTDWMTLFREGGVAGNCAYSSQQGGGGVEAQFNIGTDPTGGKISKWMAAYNTDDFAAVMDGGTVGTDSAGATPDCADLIFGNAIVGQEVTQWNGWLVEWELFNFRPSNVAIVNRTA